jgi:hypothetical protein
VVFGGKAAEELHRRGTHTQELEVVRAGLFFERVLVLGGRDASVCTSLLRGGFRGKAGPRAERGSRRTWEGQAIVGRDCRDECEKKKKEDGRRLDRQ